MSEGLDEPRLLDLLATADLEVEGRLRDASNATLRCVLPAHPGLRCVVKPVAGERPLWDFPEWTLTRREIAAFALSQALGWDLVPPTAWREDGPGGPGMCQLWIEEVPQARPVDVVPSGQVPAGWRHVLDAEDGVGNPVSLVHDDDEALLRLAVFDVLANNADRKGGHVLAEADGRLWGIDHGVTFAVEDKLRTVLWGWAGDALPDHLLEALHGLHDVLGDGFDPVDRWLDEEERQALRARLRDLLRAAVMPLPSGRWPAIPWPVF